MDQTDTSPSGRGAVTVTCGLVPVIGLLFFGWNLAAVIFMICLDTVLCTLRIIPAMVAGTWANENDEHPVFSLIVGLIVAMLAWGFVGIPLWHAIQWPDNLVTKIHLGGLRAEAYDLMFDAPGWFAVLVAGRMIHCILDLLAARSERRKAFTAMAEVQIGFCFVKGLALFGVAWFALFFRYAGPWGVAAFVVL